MHRMNAKDIRELSNEEMRKAIRETRDNLLRLRIQQKTGQLENPLQIRLQRREIARLFTEQNSRKQKKRNHNSKNIVSINNNE